MHVLRMSLIMHMSWTDMPSSGLASDLSKAAGGSKASLLQQRLQLSQHLLSLLQLCLQHTHLNWSPIKSDLTVLLQALTVPTGHCHEWQLELSKESGQWRRRRRDIFSGHAARIIRSSQLM